MKKLLFAALLLLSVGYAFGECAVVSGTGITVDIEPDECYICEDCTNVTFVGEWPNLAITETLNFSETWTQDDLNIEINAPDWPQIGETHVIDPEECLDFDDIDLSVCASSNYVTCEEFDYDLILGNLTCPDCATICNVSKDLYDECLLDKTYYVELATNKSIKLEDCSSSVLAGDGELSDCVALLSSVQDERDFWLNNTGYAVILLGAVVFFVLLIWNFKFRYPPEYGYEEEIEPEPVPVKKVHEAVKTMKEEPKQIGKPPRRLEQDKGE